MLSDVNHQSINRNLSEPDYKRATHFMKQTGVQLNSYNQYQKWGSLSTPLYTIGVWLLNWAFWYAIFYWIGGHGLGCALFTAGMLWFILVRGEKARAKRARLTKMPIYMNWMDKGLKTLHQ
jgi:sn-1 stearoyl-lipid 9-desaturase